MPDNVVKCFECCSTIHLNEEPCLYDPNICYEDDEGEHKGARFHLHCWVTPEDTELNETASRLGCLLETVALGLRNFREGYEPECGDVLMTDLQRAWQLLQDEYGQLAKHAGG